MHPPKPIIKVHRLRIFSDRNRPVHLGPFPLERLARLDPGQMPDLARVPRFQPLDFRRPDTPHSIVNAMGEYQAMMDAIRDGLVNKTKSSGPSDQGERANHIKSFGYFSDAAMVGISGLPASAHLETPVRNPDIDRLAHDLQTRQTKTLASGIDLIMADLKDAMQAPPATIAAHTNAITLLFDMPRDPRGDEPGIDWLADAQAHRACLRASEAAVVLANYLRLLGWDAKAHSATSSDVDLNQLAVSAGLAMVEQGQLTNPYLGTRFGLAVVTTTYDLAHDAPLAPSHDQPRTRTHGVS
ncbi:MAG TPA: NAD-binding oxidoreductase, partial [Roseibacterium sp.]|nr:NAD-binding oxidoreductase [Roseibacterium sp.]